MEIWKPTARWEHSEGGRTGHDKCVDSEGGKEVLRLLVQADKQTYTYARKITRKNADEMDMRLS